MVYVGMDVHGKRTQVAVLSDDGTQLMNRNVPNDPGELAAILGPLGRGTPAVFEAAYGWGWLAELCEDLGMEPHLAHPFRCKAIASARLKNDKVDARTLAQLLRTDLLPEAWIAPPEIRDLRALLRHRARLVRLSTSLKTRIHAVIADRGARVEDNLWTHAGRDRLATLDLAPTQRAIVQDCLALIDAIDLPLRRLRAEIRPLAKPDPRGRGPAATPRDRPDHRHDARGRDRRHRPVPLGSQTLRLGRPHPYRSQLRSQGPPGPHLQAGVVVGPLDPGRGGPGGKDPTALRPHLRADRPAPRQPHRHRGHRPQALGSLLLRPQRDERGTTLAG
jgi:transposase